MREKFLNKVEEILHDFCWSKYQYGDWKDFQHPSDEADVNILELEDGYKLIVFCYAYAVVVKDGMVAIGELTFDDDYELGYSIVESVI